MSGGVDSSVTAALLREQGYRVIGLFMKNWEETGPDDQCTSAQDWEDVQRVCEKLDIPHYAVNFAKEYWDGVFAQFLKEYQQGYTPNPDILCNREIKFKVFFEKAMQLGADYLATGHYCQNRLDATSGRYQLVKGTDPGKDQTYFLYAIDGSVLDRVLFPIGDTHKSEVRRIAEKYDLATKAKKDSTGICFIGERDFTQFLSQYVQTKPGSFRLLDGTRVGTHQGAAFYTPGQRKGLGLGGQGEPWFVVGKDAARKVAAEGIEALKELSPKLDQVLLQLAGGIQSGMGYLGAATLGELRNKARYIRVTSAGQRESAPHDVIEVKTGN
jgi:tRNA-specific 2-thiouridylase